MTGIATVRIGTRGSRLAIAQAGIARDALTTVLGPTQVVPIATHGDAISARRPRGGWVASDGQFTRALEQSLLDGEVDLVVHSYKDLPTAATEGLVIGAVLARADPRDCLLTADGGGIEDVPFGAHVGTSSPRRAAQLAAARPDLIAVPMRGNVETRLGRLRDGELDALILAAAGLDRLKIPIPEQSRLPLELMLPAPGQAALAIQLRAGDGALRRAVARADHEPTRIATAAERALLRRIGGGCLAPLGAHGEVHGGTLRLRAVLEDASGVLRRGEASGPSHDSDAVVGALAARITGA